MTLYKGKFDRSFHNDVRAVTELPYFSFKIAPTLNLTLECKTVSYWLIPVGVDMVTFVKLRIHVKGDKCDHVKRGSISPHFYFKYNFKT